MCGTRSSLARSHKGRYGGENLKIGAGGESNQKSERVNRIPWLEATTASSSLAPQAGRGDPGPHLTPHCVLATRGGVAWVMNWVASSMAVPNGVGITSRNGTRIRVPATGTNAISMLRWAARYLITGRSGM